MENLEKLESRMMQDINEYVRDMDAFETALNARQTKWHDRARVSKRLAAARNKTLTLIISAAIVVTAVFTILTVLLAH